MTLICGVARLTELLVARRPPDYIRSDHGPEFTARAVGEWLSRAGVKTLYIETGSPWENAYNQSFNGKLRDELLNGEIFYRLIEGEGAAVVERVACIPNLQTYVDYKVVQFTGNGTLTGVKIRKMAGDETLDLPAKGAFIAVGLEPDSLPGGAPGKAQCLAGDHD